MSVCSSCGAAIFWAHTPSGKAMPLDRTATDTGNVDIDRAGTAHVISSDAAKQAALADGRRLYTTHFSTCPDADRHRKATR